MRKEINNSSSNAGNHRQRKQQQHQHPNQQQQQQQHHHEDSNKSKKQLNGSLKSATTSSSSMSSSSGTAMSKSNTAISAARRVPPTTPTKIKTQNKNPKIQQKERAERESLVLWRRPWQTTKYCALELVALLETSCRKLVQQGLLLAALIVLGIVISVIYCIPGPHQKLIDIVHKNTWFFIYWIGLGVLSSVGLGTGLHTFLLYLGPHIASVTLAAYECNSLNFPSPPYPDDIICPDEPYVKRIPNIWTIMSKVRLEAFLWGAGTALGELPPYFMARAARLSGYDPEDAEELAEFEALKAKRNQKNLSIMDRGKLFMERVVERVGFFGILASASIPNPLFDLAGITCGHFLVPFWTFFGATLIGKAVIKMHIQKVFVIIAFNETLIERAVDWLAAVPVFGRKLQEPFKGFLENQKQRLHRNKAAAHAGGTDSGNLLSKTFETFVIGMVCYFVVSIINSLAQSYHKRLHKKRKHATTVGAAGAAAVAAAAAASTGTQSKKGKHKVARD